LLPQVKDKPEVQEKLQRRIASTEVKILNPPRPGAALLRQRSHCNLHARRLHLMRYQ
jgi:hypothetical protein